MLHKNRSLFYKFPLAKKLTPWAGVLPFLVLHTGCSAGMNNMTDKRLQEATNQSLSSQGRCSLHIIIRLGTCEKLDFMQKLGINDKVKASLFVRKLIKLKSYSYEEKLLMENLYHQMGHENFTKLFKSFLDDDKDSLLLPDLEGHYPLHLIATDDFLLKEGTYQEAITDAIIQFYAENKSIDIQSQGEFYAYSALYFAVENKNVIVVTKLINAGADVNSRFMHRGGKNRIRSSNGETVLHQSIKMTCDMYHKPSPEDFKIFHILLAADSTNVFARDAYDATPIDVANRLYDNNPYKQEIIKALEEKAKNKGPQSKIDF